MNEIETINEALGHLEYLNEVIQSISEDMGHFYIDNEWENPYSDNIQSFEEGLERLCEISEELFDLINRIKQLQWREK